MSQPYVGEIRIFAGNFAPAGWHFCDGSLLPISENETLFNLIGTTYGGDGLNTFAVPDLRGRLPIHISSSYTLGASGGVEEVTLLPAQLPGHTHALRGSTGNGSQASPQGNYIASSTVARPFANETPDANLAATASGSVGGGQPHSNIQPFLCVNFIISLFGIFPST